MRIALPIWNNRLSPVMDAAKCLLIVDYDGGREVSRTQESIGEYHALQLPRVLSDMGVELLICGGISRDLYASFESHLIKVVPWIAGQAEEVLDAYNTNRLRCRRFLMFGRHGRWLGAEMRQGRQRGRRRRWGQRTPPHFIEPNQEKSE
jgi:predicted Fe-Mo cluster-binding NifX family protein